MILGIDRLLKRVGILPDEPSTLQRRDADLNEVRQVDEEQEQFIEEAREHLQERRTRDLTENEFMQEVLQIKRRRNGESH